jgi:hypothetical protein
MTNSGLLDIVFNTLTVSLENNSMSQIAEELVSY